MKTFITALTLLSFMAFPAFGSETVEGLKKDYQTFKQEMSAKLEAMDKKIEKLKAESKQKGQVAKENAAKDLEIARNKLNKELNEAKETSSSKWVEFKKGFAQSVDNLNSKVQNALKE